MPPRKKVEGGRRPEVVGSGRKGPVSIKPLQGKGTAIRGGGDAERSLKEVVSEMSSHNLRKGALKVTN